MGIVIVEGVDGTGKSTLVNKLIQDAQQDKRAIFTYNMNSQDIMPRTYEGYTELFSTIAQFSHDYRDPLIILDRAFIGTLVYDGAEGIISYSAVLKLMKTGNITLVVTEFTDETGKGFKKREKYSPEEIHNELTYPVLKEQNRMFQLFANRLREDGCNVMGYWEAVNEVSKNDNKIG